MVVRVAPGQVRFVLPHLTVDARGVALGRDLVFRFASLDRLVTFLRFVSAELGFDELGTKVQIRFVRAAHGPREVFFFVEQSSPHVTDTLARAARSAAGQAFTGAGRHFVALRDAHSPLGYDVETLAAGPGDVHLYAPDVDSAFVFEGELSLRQLLLRLELQRVQTGPESLTSRRLPPALYVTIRQGLGPALIESLHHAGVRASAGIVSASQVPGAALTEPRLWLFRIEQPPARLSGLLAHTPGLTAYVPVTDSVAVALGYRHPIHLDACRNVFDEASFVLFPPPPGVPRVVAPVPQLRLLDDLVRVPSTAALAPASASVSAPAPIDLETHLRLVRVPPRGEGPVGTLVPWTQVGWVQRIGVGLPQPALTSYRIVALPQGLLVVAAESLQWFPFGTLLTSVARGVLVPVGFGLRPAVSHALLEERLGTADGSLVVFPAPDGKPFRVASGDLVPLEKHVLGHLPVDRQTPRWALGESGRDAGAPEVRYRGGLSMPLWGRG